MRTENTVSEAVYQVVVNHEEQYSIWSVSRDIPLGWSPVGMRGTEAECLAYIEQVWTDMRPLSLRQKMSTAEKAFAAHSSDGQAGLPRPTSEQKPET